MQQIWNQTSPELLERCESRLLRHVYSPYKTYTVPLNNPPFETEFIRTFEMVETNRAFSTPIVIVHGFASGLATFVNVFQALAEHCSRVYAIDLLGFGRSSKPTFPSDSRAAEAMFLDSLEAWRIQMQLTDIILCAHSFGAYVAANYARKYPGHVKGLILFEPWGLPAKARSGTWFETYATTVNPLRLLKLLGPAALPMMTMVTESLFQQTFAEIGEEDEMLLYLYHSNVQCTGDAGFMTLKAPLHLAKRPLSLYGLRNVNVIYGSDSWVFAMSEPADSTATVEVILGAGHQIYADQLGLFVEAVLRAVGRIGCNIS
jgi:pimeloyl-ACP methyl ester carboxylesterase